MKWKTIDKQHQAFQSTVKTESMREIFEVHRDMLSLWGKRGFVLEFCESSQM